MPDHAISQSPPATLAANRWTAASFPETRGWVRPLEAVHCAEIEAATRAALARGKRFHELTPADFPLPLTASLLRAAFEDLENGPGFAVLGGFPVERYGYDEVLIAYAGLASHLGGLVDQTYDGAMKVDVKDIGLPYNKESRGYQSSALLPFHTDGACLTGLLCLGEAESGGESVLVSSSTLHDIVARERPELYAVLARGFHHHRRGQHAPDEPKISPAIPVFGFKDGLLLCTYDRNQSIWAGEEGIALEPTQLEAMDYLDALMARPELQLRMEMRRGDIQLVNNFLVMHSRSEYRDGPGHKRHLVRLWLDVPGGKRAGVTTRDLYVRRGRLAHA